MKLSPVITEKSLKQVENTNEYTFLVGRHFTKYGVRKAVEETFDVHVLNVQTKISRGKAKRAGKTRRMVHSTDLKYALVKLAPKEKISLFEIKEQSKSKSKKEDK